VSSYLRSLYVIENTPLARILISPKTKKRPFKYSHRHVIFVLLLFFFSLNDAILFFILYNTIIEP